MPQAKKSADTPSVIVITLLLTDIERSSEHWLRDPPAMSHALVRHDTIIRQAVETEGGRLVKDRGEGDSLFTVFPTPEAALRAALLAQRGLVAEGWPGDPLRVRMVVHTCEADERDGDYYGVGVIETTRLRDLGHGGQTLVTEAAANVMGRARRLDGGTLRRIGSVRVPPSGIAMDIFQLCHPDLADDFPPLRVKPVVSGLPHLHSELVGREREIRDVARLLAHGRLLTLVGSGGVGKTHLAIGAAGKLSGSFRDGVAFVALDSLPQGAQCGQLLFEAIGGKDSDGDAVEGAIERLAGQDLLLILDSCEGVVDDAAQVAERVLRNCPQVRVLATSQESLGVGGEALLPVRGLEWPKQQDDLSVEQWPATQLFLDSGPVTDPGPVLDDGSRAAIRDIAEFLEGHPLAIVLAAAQLTFLSPIEIRDRLRARPLAVGTHRTGPDRHRRLETCLDWSCELLSPGELAAFETLAVFADRFTSADAEFVLDEVVGDPPQSLFRLAAKSLVTVEQAAGLSRYHLAPVVRDYARIRLSAGERERLAADRHAAWCQRLVDSYDRESPYLADAIERLVQHRADLRAALRHLETHEKWESALRLAGGLRHFWYAQGSWTEGRRVLDRLLVKASGAHVDAAVRAEALMGLGTLGGALGDVDAANYHRAALNLWRDIGHEMGQAWALNNLGMIAYVTYRLDDAREAFEASLDIRTRLGVSDPHALLNLGLVLWKTGELERADEMIAAAERLSYDGRIIDRASALHARGAVAIALGNYDHAARLLSEAARLADAVHDNQLRAEILRSLAFVEFERQSLPRSEAHFKAAQDSDRGLDDQSGLLETLVFMVRCNFESPSQELTVRLLDGARRSIACNEIWLGAESLAALAYVYSELGELDTAARHLRHALRLVSDGGDVLAQLDFLENSVLLLSVAGARQDAAEVAAAVQVERARYRAPASPSKASAIATALEAGSSADTVRSRRDAAVEAALDDAHPWTEAAVHHRPEKRGGQAEGALERAVGVALTHLAQISEPSH